MDEPFFEERWTLVTVADGEDEYIRREYILRNATKSGGNAVWNTERIEIPGFVNDERRPATVRQALKAILDARGQHA